MITISSPGTWTRAELQNAILRIWKGERYISSQIADMLQQESDGRVLLTDGEQHVLNLLCDGLTNREIAARMGLSLETINWYRKRLLGKFGVKNTVALVSMVLRHRMLTD